MPATHHSSAPPNSSEPTAEAEKEPAGKEPAKKTAAKKATARKATGKKAAKPAARVPGPPGPPGSAGTRPAAAQTTLGRIPVLDVRPVVQHGRRPAKAVTGESFEVSATVFREGHDAVGANVVLRDPKGRVGPWTPLRELAPGTDRWGATVTAGEPGRWTYTVEAWSDPVATWRHHARIKIPAGMDTELVLEEGARLYERAAAEVPARQRPVLREAVRALRDEDRPAAWRLAAAFSPEVEALLARHPLRDLVTASDPMPLLVERERALYGSWYEFFPRSEGTAEQPHGTFRTAARRLKPIADMGFDVVYLPPVHPIGTTFRKGPDNTLTAGPD
ncbi:maltotransferase domain-containing protein, partial [Streptomyces sp. NPDC002589]|uniref:maltotransferase domain-containing protein n=1 Tax=Streptomyces sp. NPDC002589 TaxID=3154420 RepID=UPI00331A8C23